MDKKKSKYKDDYSLRTLAYYQREVGIYNELIKEMTTYTRLKELDSYCGFCYDSEPFKNISEEDDENLLALSQLSIGCEEYDLTPFKEVIDYYFFTLYIK